MFKAIAYADTLAQRFWRRVGNAVDTNTESLALFRIIFGLFMLLFSTPYTAWLGSVPQAFFNPPYLSFANLVSNFPPAPFFYTLDILAVLLLGCITFGIKARFNSLAFFVVAILGNSFTYSFGKIDHSFLVLALVLCMAFSTWGTRYALLPDKPHSFDNRRLSLGVFAVLVAFGMLTAGFLKALYWIDFDPGTSGFLRWFYSGYYTLGRTELLAPFVTYVPTSFFELADYTAVFFELSGFIFLLLGRRAWRSWLLAAAAFHLINTLVLNINFNRHFLVYLAFVDFSALRSFVRLNVNNKLLKRGVFLFTIVLVLTHFGYQLSGQKFSILFTSNPDARKLGSLYISIAIWLTALVVLSSNLLLTKTESERSFAAAMGN